MRPLALFDAPIDPGLLIAAQAAGVDLSSVLSNVFAPLPNYRFTSLYPVAPWQAFLAPAVAPANQTLTLSISPSKFPAPGHAVKPSQ